MPILSPKDALDLAVACDRYCTCEPARPGVPLRRSCPAHQLTTDPGAAGLLVFIRTYRLEKMRAAEFRDDRT